MKKEAGVGPLKNN